MRRNSARFPRFHAKTLQNSFPIRVSLKVLALKNSESLKNSEGVENAQSFRRDLSEFLRTAQSFCAMAMARQSAASVAASGRPAQLLRCDLHY